MKEYIFSNEKGSVHYWHSDIGSATTLVFLHGLTADHRLFNEQIRYFEKKYNCLVWDAPAHGLSRPYKDFSYPDAAEVLLAILNKCRIQKPILIGQSMGGFIVQSFLLRYPDRAKAFVSIDSCPYGEKYYSRSDKWWLRQIEWMAKYYPLALLKDAVAKQCTVTDRARRNMRAMLESYGKEELCHLMGIGYAGFLEDNQDMVIPCPLWILAGEKDHTGKVKKYNMEWAQTVGSPVHWIRQAAHNANDDRPEIVNALIEELAETTTGKE